MVQPNVKNDHQHSPSVSVADSFHTAFSTVPTQRNQSTLSSANRPPLPPPSQTSSKLSARHRWLFSKNSSPPRSPNSQPSSKHLRSKPDRYSFRGSQAANESRRTLHSGRSERSSRSSVEGGRSSRPLDLDSHQSLHLNVRRLSNAQTNSIQPSPAPPTLPSISNENESEYDWDLDEMSEEELEALAPRATHQNSNVTSEPGPASLRSLDTSAILQAKQSSDSLRSGHRDTLTLRAFDETPQRDSIPRTEFSGVNNVVGVYADPAAETDDWGDDFVLDNSNAEQSSGSAPSADFSFAQFPAWLDEAPPLSARLAETLNASVIAVGQSSLQHPMLHIASAEVLPRPDDMLPVRPIPSGAFSTPMISHSSLLMYPSVGYQASAVHPSSAKVRDFFVSHSQTIRKHFDALVRDSKGTNAFDELTRTAYLLSRDEDVGVLSPSNLALATDVLFWKLDWANLTNDHVEKARLLLSLSKIYKDSKDFQSAMRILRDALNVLSAAETSSLSIAVATELEHESAVLHRAVGALAEAGRSLMRAMSHSATLAKQDLIEPALPSSSQRGYWWQLRCKYLRAEIAYDLKELDTSVQFYSEYILDGLSRMIGIVDPPCDKQGSIGPEYMRYCLFSPRRLALAFWTIVLCLGEMRCFAAAADIANLTSLVASAFGYEDINVAALSVRNRMKVIAIELRLRYDEISKSSFQGENIETDEHYASSVHSQDISQIQDSSFHYGVGGFGDVSDDVVEDWDAQLEKELNITIQRCCDYDVEHSESLESPEIERKGDGDVGVGNEPVHASVEQPLIVENRMPSRTPGRSSESLERVNNNPNNMWRSGMQEGHLIEAELRQYLQRLTGTISSLPSRLMYPKPTESFSGHLMGPKDHEKFLRTFVRSKDPEWCRRTTHGLFVTRQWHPSAACKLNFNIEPIEEIDSFNSGVQILSTSWGLRLLESVWKVVRSQVSIQTKQSRLRRLILNAFSKVAASSRRVPIHDELDRRERLELLGALLDALRLAREAVTDSGKEAVWFSRACNSLSVAAATVTPAAKAAVELFQAESRAHCGVKAVVPSKIIEKCENFALECAERENRAFATKEDSAEKRSRLRIDVPVSLRHSVTDLLHALYWQTKAGFDASSAPNSLERLLHADVASSLFLTGSGVSPVDGSVIDLTKEVQLLHFPKKRKTKSIDSELLVDETRRVSSVELVRELQSLWSSLSFSAGVVQAKVSFALAYHARVTQRNYSRAERLLFYGLQSMHAVSNDGSFPNSFFSPVVFISPVSIVSSPLSGAILNEYGDLTCSHSKYRYGIAALEAVSDAVRVQNKDKQTYRASVFDTVDIALKHNDWRKGISLLYEIRTLLHPNIGLRNEFLRLCVLMHNICLDAGCLGASVVPLRAFSALIYEERLRVLLQQYKRRLAKKKRNRFRRYVASTPLPKLLPSSSMASERKTPLATFFEVPIVTAAIDSAIQNSAILPELRPRPSLIAVPNTSDVSRRHGNIFTRFLGVFWPLKLVLGGQNPTLANSDLSAAEKKKPTDQESPVNGAPSTIDQNNPKSIFANDNSFQSPLFDESNHLSGDGDGDVEGQHRELLRIEAEQETKADSDRCQVELLRVELDYAQGDHLAAEERCRGLLEISTAPEIRCKVLEVMTRIRLKRREIGRCLELINQLEHEYDRVVTDYRTTGKGAYDSPRMFHFRAFDLDRVLKSDETRPLFIPQVTFLRIKALTHGGRLDEALLLADRALGLCQESSFWDMGRLHYLRGKVLYTMSCTSTPVYRREAEVSTGKTDNESELILKMTELAMEAFETSSYYFDIAGDDLSVAKSDLKWARTCIDYLFRKVVLSKEAGGGVPLTVACQILDRRISISDVQQVIYNVLNTSWNASVPLLLIDSMAALAEIKCIRGHHASSWMSWVLEAWKLFSRLFVDTEDLSVVLSTIAPVSYLMRLRDLCARLVRLVMCNQAVVNTRDMNKHLRLFEAYVKLHLVINQKMNLSSSVHRREFDDPSSTEPESADIDNTEEEEIKATPRMVSRSVSVKDTASQPQTPVKATVKIGLPRLAKPQEKKSGGNPNDKISEPVPDRVPASSHRRPAGAFLHVLGHEGIALGRKGVSMLINRPRKQVISAVKETGAVFIPTNFFSNSRTPSESHELGKDAELIFPFKSSLGLGAMQILDNGSEDEFSKFQPRSPKPPLVGIISETNTNECLNSTLEREENSEVHGNIISPPDEIQPVTHTANQATSDAIRDLPSEEERPKPETDITDKDPNPQPKPIQGSSRKRPRNELAGLAAAIAAELEHGSMMTNGRSLFFGATTSARIWAHVYRVKAESKRFMHGEITLHQLQERNYEAMLSWMQCIPVSRKEWNVPESIRRRLVYVLYAHGIVGYYAVERGGSIAHIAFGGKQEVSRENNTELYNEQALDGKSKTGLRPPTDQERNYLCEMVREFKRDEVWHKNRDWEIVNGLASQVLKAPRVLLKTSSPVLKSRSRPIVLVADLTLQILPWELFFDHMVIRSHCLLDVIRGAQNEIATSWNDVMGAEEANTGITKRMVQYINFIPARSDVIDLERTEEARRLQLAIQSLTQPNQLHAESLVSFLDLRGFSDPMAVNAVARPTGPLSSPLSQSRTGIQLFGMRIAGNIGKRNFPHLDFIKVPGLGSATTMDLKEAVLTMNTQIGGTEDDEFHRRSGLGAHISVFMFSYADLVDCGEAVFGLRREVANSILMFSPAIYMKVLARHLEDEELSVEIDRVCGRWRSRIFPDIVGVARVVIEHVSRFAREKRIPIVVFLGDGLMDVFANRRHVQIGNERKTPLAGERILQLSGGGRIDYIRRTDTSIPV